MQLIIIGLLILLLGISIAINVLIVIQHKRETLEKDEHYHSSLKDTFDRAWEAGVEEGTRKEKFIRTQEFISKAYPSQGKHAL